jgi:hypothetical protein
VAGRNEPLDSLSATDSTAPIALASYAEANAAPTPAAVSATRSAAASLIPRGQQPAAVARPGVASPSALVVPRGRPSRQRWTRAGLGAAPVRQFTIGEGLQVMNSARAATLARVSQWEVGFRI